MVFYVSSKQEDKVRTYTSDNNVNVMEIKSLPANYIFLHSHKVVIYRKLVETAMDDHF